MRLGLRLVRLHLIAVPLPFSEPNREPRRGAGMFEPVPPLRLNLPQPPCPSLLAAPLILIVRRWSRRAVCILFFPFRTAKWDSSSSEPPPSPISISVPSLFWPLPSLSSEYWTISSDSSDSLELKAAMPVSFTRRPRCLFCSYIYCLCSRSRRSPSLTYWFSARSSPRPGSLWRSCLWPSSSRSLSYWLPAAWRFLLCFLFLFFFSMLF